MKVAVVGAGVAGLTAALALQRDGHEVRVYEKAEALRDSGFGLNLWSNAGSLLDALGVDIPGEPYDHMNFRAGGRTRLRMSLPTNGLPHMNVERGGLIRAIARRLAAGTISFGSDVASAAELLDVGTQLVVAADGVGSMLRPDAGRQQRTSAPWSVWQAVIPEGGDLIEPGGGIVVVQRHRFFGLWRHPDSEMCWFMEEPSLPPGASAADVLADLREDSDPLIAQIAAMTPPGRLGEWLARDRWPTRRIIGDRVVAVGDAAHPMQPCIGQGACTSIEDGVTLAVALRGASVEAGLRNYRRRRLALIRLRVATSHVACSVRRPSPLASTIAATPVGVPFAFAAGTWLRVLNRANPRLVRDAGLSTSEAATDG